MKTLSFLILCLITPSLAAEKSQLITQLEAGKKQVVVTYGTSLTEGGAWVKHIATAIDEQFPGLCTIHNKGGSGQNSDWGVKNLEERVLKLRPNTVFLEFSMNDSAERFNISVEMAKSNLETMLNAILTMNPQCEIILMTMTPGDLHPKGHRSYRNNIEGHYEMYREVAKERKLLLIDHYPNWKALEANDKALYKTMVPDSIHPTAGGCEKIITPVILEAIGVKLREAKNP